LAVPVSDLKATCDVIQIDNLWLIDINDSQPKQRLKNLNSHRKVPLHPVLIKLGFISMIIGNNLPTKLN
jgi:hypothetical protein